MTSRDFRLIASVIAQADTGGNEAVRTALAIDFANALARTSPRFDRERFIRAAVVGDKDAPRDRDYR